MHTVLYKCFKPSTKIIYDIQEDYAKNIRYQSVYSPFIKPILLFGLRILYILSKPFISTYLLAEYCYKKDIPLGKPTYVIPNTCHWSYIKKKKVKEVLGGQGHKIKLAYTGTIQMDFGLKRAVSFVDELSKYIDCELCVVGSWGDKAAKELVNQKQQNVVWEVQDAPIPNEHIKKTLIQSDLSLLPYHTENPSIKRACAYKPVRVYLCDVLSYCAEKSFLGRTVPRLCELYRL